MYAIWKVEAERRETLGLGEERERERKGERETEWISVLKSSQLWNGLKI